MAENLPITVVGEPRGDINRDGAVNMLDFAIIAEDWLQKAEWAR